MKLFLLSCVYTLESLALWLVRIPSRGRTYLSAPWWPNRLRFEDTRLQEAFFFRPFQLSGEFPHKAHFSSQPLLLITLVLECTIPVAPAQCHRPACLWLGRAHIFTGHQRHYLDYIILTACALRLCFLILFWGVKFWIMGAKGLRLESCLRVFPLKKCLWVWVTIKINKLLLINGQMMDALRKKKILIEWLALKTPLISLISVFSS